MRTTPSTVGQIDPGPNYPTGVTVLACHGSPGAFNALSWDVRVTYQRGPQQTFEGVGNSAPPPPPHMQDLDYHGQDKGIGFWSIDASGLKFAFAIWADYTECEE